MAVDHGMCKNCGCRMVNDNILVLSNTPFDAEDERGIIFMDDLYGKIFGT